MRSHAVYIEANFLRYLNAKVMLQITYMQLNVIYAVKSRSILS